MNGDMAAILKTRTQPPRRGSVKFAAAPECDSNWVKLLGGWIVASFMDGAMLRSNHRLRFRTEALRMRL